MDIGNLQAVVKVKGRVDKVTPGGGSRVKAKDRVIVVITTFDVIMSDETQTLSLDNRLKRLAVNLQPADKVSRKVQGTVDKVRRQLTVVIITFDVTTSVGMLTLS